MSDRRVHGLPVDLDEVSRALNETRVLRLEGHRMLVQSPDARNRD
jgi:hypothetical protein